MIKIEIEKIKNTCIFLNSVMYKPTESKRGIDYYELPSCSEKSRVQIIHYSGNDLNGVQAVFDESKSIHQVIKSLDIDLYYCKMEFFITEAKRNNVLRLKVEQHKHKDMIGKSAYCELIMVQKKNVDFSDILISYYPSNKVKYSVFLIEFFTDIIAFAILIVCDIWWGIECIKHWDNPTRYDNPFNFYVNVIPLGIAAIVFLILDFVRIKKHTLLIGKKK
ncbi:MAG: hypothetical protein K2K42_04030 [Eubacterium sp.]|nr:hypothetical protein [Eubacterium sp.]